LTSKNKNDIIKLITVMIIKYFVNGAQSAALNARRTADSLD